MLAQLDKPHNDFHALAHYLVHGNEKPTHPDRVAWVFGHNIPDDPARAAKLMAATAELSRRCTNACYHATINWHPDEAPTPEIMQEIARKTLDLAGLGEHQALVMGHGDKPHRHLHMMINRVHPETGRAWSTSHDYRRFDRIMKQLAEEYGFRHVLPHSFHPELTDELPKAPNSGARYAARRGARTARPQWSRKSARRFGARISANLTHASTWGDVEQAFGDHGLKLEAKGGGLVAGDEAGYAKFSALGLAVTAKGLARRFGKSLAPPRKPRRSPPKRKVQAWANGRNVFSVDAIDIARALGSRDDVLHAIRDAARQRKARLAKKPLIDQLLADQRQQLKSWTALSGRGKGRHPLRRPAKHEHRGRDK